MKKRILAALLAAVIILTLAGCANNEADAPAPDTTRPTVTATAETTGTAESDTDTEHTEEKKNSTAEETKPAATKPQTTEKPESESKPAETVPKETEQKPTETKPAETKPSQTESTEQPKVEETKPETKPTEPETPPKQTEEKPKETKPEVTEPPKVTEPPAQTQPEVTEPEKEAFTEADHKRIIAEVTAYAESYANKGFTFEWKESMTFGWDVGYMGTPRVEYEGVNGVINTLKYHIDLIFKTSTDPMYGITTEYMTYKVEQITVDGDLAYVVIYGNHNRETTDSHQNQIGSLLQSIK